ncbi:GRAM domain-containing protein 1B [Portunus trituberculatus]|uniref:GRAM domain-containing protein 1B n=1 Tax=Portunus trituberculatus TaxID=210409 RepID=A0A5B7CRL1_PORTR|nr:GRAM domain-containing protein 1B [Portunus trituberculatus]
MASKCPSASSQENDSKKSRKTVTIEKVLEMLDRYGRGEKTSPDSVSRSSESSRSVEAPRTPEIGSNINGVIGKERKESRDSKSGDKKSNKAWYKMLNPTYKSRSEDLKRLFKDLPSDERLIVDYSCALQKDILVHGRLYVTPNYFCFYSKIFGWETFQMSATELWQWVHSSYGDELGLTSDDDDYVAPSTEDDAKTNTIMHGTDRSCDAPSLNPAHKLFSVDSIELRCVCPRPVQPSRKVWCVHLAGTPARYRCSGTIRGLFRLCCDCTQYFDNSGARGASVKYSTPALASWVRLYLRKYPCTQPSQGQDTCTEQVGEPAMCLGSIPAGCLPASPTDS